MKAPKESLRIDQGLHVLPKQLRANTTKAEPWYASLNHAHTIQWYVLGSISSEIPRQQARSISVSCTAWFLMGLLRWAKKAS